MSMPAQRPGRSKQTWQTPPELLNAILNRLCIKRFDIDLAASDANAVTSLYYTEKDDALDDKNVWKAGTGWAWCNPPYSDLEPWVIKAGEQSYEHGANICMLVPSSVGADWWHDWVEDRAYVIHLNGRITFVGATGPYPKDCSLLLFTPWGAAGSETWNWRAGW